MPDQRIERRGGDFDLACLPHVSAMELGVQFPNLFTVLRVAVALDCKVMDLVGV